MRKHIVWQLLLSCWLCLGLATNSIAEEMSPALRALVTQFLDENPAVQAAEAEYKRAEAQARASGQPLYNPELELEYEEAGDVTKSVGISQTFDWSGKRRARERVSGEAINAAAASLAATRQTLLTDFLFELGNATFANLAAQLSTRKVAILEEFVALAKRRFSAGDVGQTEVDLAHLALSEARMKSASLQSDAAESYSRFSSLFRTSEPTLPALPALPETLPASDVDMLLGVHPSVRQAKAEVALAGASVVVARRDSRPDPTLGVQGGKEGDEDLVGLSLSVPLFVRNNYRAKLDVANADAIRAEEAYWSTFQRARSELESARQRYQFLRAALHSWVNEGEPRLEGRGDLLKRLWQGGEMDTTDYLVQLQQTLDTRLSAADLRHSVWGAWVSWLSASGQVDIWLGALSYAEGK